MTEPTDPDYVVIGLRASRTSPHFACILLEARMHAKCFPSGNTNAPNRSNATGLLAAYGVSLIHPRPDVSGEIRTVILDPQGHQVRQEYLVQFLAVDVGEPSEPYGELDSAPQLHREGATEVPIRVVLSIGPGRDRAL